MAPTDAFFSPASDALATTPSLGAWVVLVRHVFTDWQPRYEGDAAGAAAAFDRAAAAMYRDLVPGSVRLLDARGAVVAEAGVAPRVEDDDDGCLDAATAPPPLAWLGPA